MSFAWSRPLGWVVLPLSALFVGRYAWVTIRDMRVDRAAHVVDVMMQAADMRQAAEMLEEVFGVNGESGRKWLREWLGRLAEAGKLAGEEQALRLVELAKELQGAVATLGEKQSAG